jgi:hypothetical protein
LPPRLRRFDRLFSSNLLEAEFRSALIQEGITDSGADLLSIVTWVYPNRPLTREIDRASEPGYLRGADLWHLANALFLAPAAKELSFLTLDQRQREVAASLGFPT